MKFHVEKIMIIKVSKFIFNVLFGVMDLKDIRIMKIIKTTGYEDGNVYFKGQN